MSDIITIDIGNTRVKAVVFSGDGEVISCHVDPNFEDLLEKYKESRIIYSSVRRMDGVDFSEGQFSLLKEQGAIEFGISLCGVLDIGIQGVETLGRDRLAGMMAARYLKPGLNCLVIDAGTCLTYDYLGFDGFYGGGHISGWIGCNCHPPVLFRQTRDGVNFPEIRYTQGLPAYIGQGAITGMDYLEANKIALATTYLDEPGVFIPAHTVARISDTLGNILKERHLYGDLNEILGFSLTTDKCIS